MDITITHTANIQDEEIVLVVNKAIEDRNSPLNENLNKFVEKFVESAMADYDYASEIENWISNNDLIDYIDMDDIVQHVESSIDLDEMATKAIDEALPTDLEDRLAALEDNLVVRVESCESELEDLSNAVKQHSDSMQALDERIVRFETIRKQVEGAITNEVKFDQNLAKEVDNQRAQIRLLASYVNGLINAFNSLGVCAKDNVDSFDLNPLEQLL